ncbi:terminase large subunit domain-containing protein [Mycobacterium marinum]|uniref:terminase large subunit domain-containing protein n=1 Tax=Mycobacterium marinum TaxID=1781 RepID=UPI002359A5DD|nr:terminase family protein [Mycobacterium marinum]MDC8970723.1 terminase family protein [Mycobacterium marinum]
MITDAITALTAARAIRSARQGRRPESPAELALRLIPGYVVTPTIKLLSDELVRAVEEPDSRLIVTMPPRTGKSVLVSQVFPVWQLSRDPDAEIIVKSYGDALAEEHSAAARRLIADNAGVVGIELAADKQAVGRWRVAGHRGGMLAGGILSSTTGFGANVLVVDDPVKGAQEADSDAYRRRLIAKFKASLMTRLMPGASVIIVLTRWHTDDLAGALLAEPGSRWRCVNIPAISTAGVPDALQRDRSGVAMTSAVGRTAPQFREIAAEVGSRAWAAMYLGTPRTPEGGLIKAAWIEDWRLPAAPPGAVKIVVGVDPADSGKGDETGIIAASLAADGSIALIADVSGRMTSDAWAVRAVQLAADIGASEISIEGFQARSTYVRLVTEVLARFRVQRPIRVTSWPPKGTDRGKGDAVARSTGLLAALETGRCRVAGYLPDFEAQAVTWKAGQHQPDRVAAAVVAHDVLVHSGTEPMGIVSPIDLARRARGGRLGPVPDWMRRRIGG